MRWNLRSLNTLFPFFPEATDDIITSFWGPCRKNLSKGTIPLLYSDSKIQLIETTGIPKQIANNSLKVLEYFSITKTSKESLQFSVIVILVVGVNAKLNPDKRAVF